MDINKYIQKYNFQKYFENNRENFKQKLTVKRYLKSNSEENFKKFSEAFWGNPKVLICELKERYNIPKQIAFDNIVKAYPTDKYMNFLKMYYDNFDREKLINEFCIPSIRIKKIIIPIIVSGIKKYCPICFNNLFEITNNINGIFIMQCKGCNNILSEPHLLTLEEAKQEIEIITTKKIEFDKEIEQCEKALEDIKCPKCQEEVYIERDNNTFAYEIKCSQCTYSSNYISSTVRQFNEFREREAIISAIKYKEEQTIKKCLEIKKEKDMLFVKENIILSSENDFTLAFLNNLLIIDNIKIWNELLRRTKELNRLEKVLLSKVIELVKKEGEEYTYLIQKKEINMYLYVSKEPIIYNLIDGTNLTIVRPIIRKLINQNLIVLSEEKNYVLVPKMLIDNLEIINNLLVTSKIDPNIRYLILERQKYACVKCKETGRPLEIAYLNFDRDENNLSNLIAICDNCYDIMTQNGILIDGTITFKDDYLNNNKLRSYEFLTYYYPQLGYDESIIKVLEDLESDFALSDVIKALTITIDKIKKNKIDTTIRSLVSYTKGILKNNNRLGKPVNIYKVLKKEYNLERWIDDI
ncbi:hypothetical protein [Clostridium algidicarnis]|uniref:hypothetical protein n=1 Tax=Clostridium algidicarnis TaxID=37659 RepID=UPI001C0B67B3|nr:hypothetical protein [Clostridium algidicarnis]MBU3227374.1 hypothetical protein [Clostridium algidicarnis]MBU3251219.1 hypothetical protein [Clostridium algidicarnis]